MRGARRVVDQNRLAGCGSAAGSRDIHAARHQNEMSVVMGMSQDLLWGPHGDAVRNDATGGGTRQASAAKELSRCEL